jgi:hypothetical protein
LWLLMRSTLPRQGVGGGGRRWAVLLAVGLPLSFGALATALQLFHGLPGAGSTTQPAPAGFIVQPPPGNTQLLWLSRNEEQVPDAVRLRAFDWNGSEVGTLALPCQAPCGIQASPDGGRILVSQLGQIARQVPGGSTVYVEDGGTVFDSIGRRIGSVAGGVPNLAVTWADDSRHLCVAHGLKAPGAAGTVQLDLVDPTASVSRAVMTFVASAPVFTQVLACSPSSDRAVLVRLSDGCAGQELKVVQLSSGRMVFAHTYPSTRNVCAGSPVVTHDGAVAFDPTATGSTVVRDLTTGWVEPLATGSHASVDVSGLSWSGRRLVTTAGVIAAGKGYLWKVRPGEMIAFVAARPQSDDVFVLLSRASGAGNQRVIVRSDGSEISVPFPVDPQQVSAGAAPAP